MTIDELLKLQSEWIQKATEVALQVERSRRGMTPREIGTEQLADPAGIDEQIRRLEARRAATLKAFDTAIEAARRARERSAPPVRATTEPRTSRADRGKQKRRAK